MFYLCSIAFPCFDCPHNNAHEGSYRNSSTATASAANSTAIPLDPKRRRRFPVASLFQASSEFTKEGASRIASLPIVVSSQARTAQATEATTEKSAEAIRKGHRHGTWSVERTPVNTLIPAEAKIPLKKEK
jgi:hypothetical protein